MPPRWLRRVLFVGTLAYGTLVFASVGQAEACASVWTLDAPRLRSCCRSASQPRFTKVGGDCCDFRALEERDPSAGVAGLVVPPAQWVRVAIADILPPAAEAPVEASLGLTIPERPPDRALATIVLLI
jgi:hypothetical protein